jgi:hypothetical protein
MSVKKDIEDAADACEALADSYEGQDHADFHRQAVELRALAVRLRGAESKVFWDTAWRTGSAKLSP